MMLIFFRCNLENGWFQLSEAIFYYEDVRLTKNIVKPFQYGRR